MKHTRIAVIQGAGFIGFHVVVRLPETTSRAANLADVADDRELIEGDIREVAA